MATRRGRKHEVTIDGQTVWLDSLNEEVALKRFVEQYEFFGQWARPAIGIKHAGKYYTPDFELAINDYGNTSRALVEVKEYRKNFTKNMAARMCAIANHYHTDCLLLYAVKTDKWYRVIPRSGIVRETIAPQPGKLPLANLFHPKRLATKNYYGRSYHQSWVDSFFSLFRNVLNPSSSKHRHR